MSDPQQPGTAGDPIPPVPPAPGAEVPPVPPVPPAPPAGDAPADAAPAAPVPPVTPAEAASDPAAPANPYAPAAGNPYAAQQNPYAPQQQNPYAAPGAPAYAAAPAGPSRFNVLGLVSLIAGGVAFLFGITLGWIPFVGFIFVFLALVGVVLGIIGLIVKNKGKGLAIAGTIVSGVALLLTAIVSIVMLAFVSSIQQGLDDLGPDDPVITDPDGGTTDDGGDPNALGSQTNPAAPGDTITFTDFDGVDEWQVVVGTPVLDATADVLAADEYNTEPEAGNQFVVVPVTYTYVGAETASPYLLLNQVVGSDAVLYDVAYATYPNSLYDAPELATGGTAEVNLLFEVPSSAVAGSLLQIGSIWGNDIYVALD